MPFAVPIGLAVKHLHKLIYRQTTRQRNVRAKWKKQKRKRQQSNLSNLFDPFIYRIYFHFVFSSLIFCFYIFAFFHIHSTIWVFYMPRNGSHNARTPFPLTHTHTHPNRNLHSTLFVICRRSWYHQMSNRWMIDDVFANLSFPWLINLDKVMSSIKTTPAPNRKRICVGKL